MCGNARTAASITWALAAHLRMCTGGNTRAMGARGPLAHARTHWRYISLLLPFFPDRQAGKVEELCFKLYTKLTLQIFILMVDFSD